MSIIKTFNNSDIPVANSTNFPALAHFFPCNEATGSTSLTDSISGVTASDGTQIGNTNNGDGTVSLGAVHNVLSKGIISSPATKNILLMWGGKPSSTNAIIVIGNAATSSSRGLRSTAGATTPAVVGDGAAAVITGTAGLSGTGTQLQSRALTITWNSATGIAPYDWDGTTWTARAAAGDLNTIPQLSMNSIDQSISFAVNLRPAFIQLWYFTTLPSAAEIKSALLWTHAYATTASLGYRKLAYPGFQYRT